MNPDDQHKKCTDCGLEKPQSDFYVQGSRLKSECKACSKRRAAARKRALPAKTKHAYHIKSFFGIDISQYNQMFEEQSGCCAICQRHQSELARALAIDHSHETGAVRGLLCSACNRAIGLMAESQERLSGAITYLAKTAQPSNVTLFVKRR